MDVLHNILDAILKAIDGFATDAPKPTMTDGDDANRRRQFVPTKSLQERDNTIIDIMLNSIGHDDISFCICDPNLDDCPIIYASDGFCVVTGYDYTEIEGKNCRFLQGPETSTYDVNKIRDAIKNQKEASVNLLNYKKDGTKFNNQFFMCPLYYSSSASYINNDDKKKSLAYFIGVQCSVKKLGPGQAPSNLGWVYTQGLHV